MRFSRLRVATIIFAAAALIGASFSWIFTEAVWVGSAMIPLEFLVLDASTGRPIGGAAVSLMDEANHPEYGAVSGPDGRASIVIRATIAGRSGLFRTTRSVNYRRWRFVVEADRHEGLDEPLTRFTGDPAFHRDSPLPSIVARLSPVPPNR